MFRGHHSERVTVPCWLSGRLFTVKLVLLHPLPLDGSVFGDSVRGLGDECFTPTLYGLGDDIESWARSVLDTVGGGPLVVVGNSIGGSCAIELARLAPTRVRALVLSGAKPDHRPQPDVRDQALRTLEVEGLRSAWDRYWLPLFGPLTAPEAIERARRVAEERGVASIANGVRVFHSRPDRAAFLASWPGRVFVVSGRHDLYPDRSRALAAVLPSASFHLIAHAGHYVPIERPDDFADVVATAVAGAEAGL